MCDLYVCCVSHRHVARVLMECHSGCFHGCMRCVEGGAAGRHHSSAQHRSGCRPADAVGVCVDLNGTGARQNASSDHGIVKPCCHALQTTTDVCLMNMASRPYTAVAASSMSYRPQITQTCTRFPVVRYMVKGVYLTTVTVTDAPCDSAIARASAARWPGPCSRASWQSQHLIESHSHERQS